MVRCRIVPLGWMSKPHPSFVLIFFSFFHEIQYLIAFRREVFDIFYNTVSSDIDRNDYDQYTVFY